MKTQPKEESRFTWWIARMDERDKNLSPGKRKQKWILAISMLFVLFILSFLLFPAANSGDVKIMPLTGSKPGIHGNANTGTFSLPVDSFENQLKIKMHENLRGKK